MKSFSSKKRKRSSEDDETSTAETNNNTKAEEEEEEKTPNKKRRVMEVRNVVTLETNMRLQIQEYDNFIFHVHAVDSDDEEGKDAVPEDADRGALEEILTPWLYLEPENLPGPDRIPIKLVAYTGKEGVGVEATRKIICEIWVNAREPVTSDDQRHKELSTYFTLVDCFYRTKSKERLTSKLAGARIGNRVDHMLKNVLRKHEMLETPITLQLQSITLGS